MKPFQSLVTCLLAITACQSDMAASDDPGGLSTSSGSTGFTDVDATSGETGDASTATATPTTNASENPTTGSSSGVETEAAGSESSGSDGADVCEDVECGPGPGACEAQDGEPHCICDPGFHAEGLECILDSCEGDDCPMTVDEWGGLFDELYADPITDRQDCEFLTHEHETQGHYFLSYCIDGLTSVWRATGDDQYLDEALRLIFLTLDETVPMGSYRGWPGPLDGSTYPLWDSYYWRHVITLVRVLHEHPEVRARGDYEAQFQELLEFSQHDLWDRWVGGGQGNIYRSRTHMASHWARIGMELHTMTGDPEYLEVFENISFDEVLGYGSSLRDQMEWSPDVPSAWVWSSLWGEPASVNIQDTSHAGAIVSLIAVAAQKGDYGWGPADVQALTSTLMDIVWEEPLDGAYWENVDGTGRLYGEPGELGGRAHEWMTLGRFSSAVQARMESEYLDPERRNLRHFYGYEAAGIGAYNARMLAYGSPVY